MLLGMTWGLLLGMTKSYHLERPLVISNGVRDLFHESSVIGKIPHCVRNDMGACSSE